MQSATQSRSRYWWRVFVDTLDVHDLDGWYCHFCITDYKNNIVFLTILLLQVYVIKCWIYMERMTINKQRYHLFVDFSGYNLTLFAGQLVF